MQWTVSSMQQSSIMTWKPARCLHSRTWIRSAVQLTRFILPAAWQQGSRWSSTCTTPCAAPSTGTMRQLHYPHAECGNSEHGGFSDHVPTPVNVPQPEDGISSGAGHQTTILHTTLHAWESGMHLTPNLSFATWIFSLPFHHSVPDFIISPWVPANLLIHDQGTIYADNSTYTHGSILHFLQELWGLEGLNNRVQWAKTFETVFTKKRPNDTPKTLVKPTWYGGSGQPEPEPFFLLNQDESYYACRRPRLRLRYKGWKMENRHIDNATIVEYRGMIIEISG